MLRLLFLCWGIGLWSIFDTPSSSTFTVTTTDDLNDANLGDGICGTTIDGDACSLRAAIQESNFAHGANHIVLPAGVYANSLGTYLITDDLTITGDSSSTTILINAQERGLPITMFDINCTDGYPVGKGCSSTVSFSDLSMIGIFSGIRNYGSDLNVENVTVEAVQFPILQTNPNNLNNALTITNSSFVGTGAGSEGVRIENGSLTVVNSDFQQFGRNSIRILNGSSAEISSSSFSNNDFSAVFARESSLIVDDAQFTNNFGEWGGAIYSENGTLTVLGSHFSSNRASRQGGAIYCQDSDAVIQDSGFENNVADLDGGAIFHLDSANAPLLVVNSQIKNNSGINGGGIFARNADIENSAIIDNSATAGDGGGLHALNQFTLTNSTISGNSATGVGGGIHLTRLLSTPKPTSSILYSTITDNQGVNGANLSVEKGYPLNRFSINSSVFSGPILGTNCVGTSKVNSQGHNLVSDSSCGFGESTDLIGVDPELEPLSLNGGSTLNHSLASLSPAIDGGDPARCPAVDQRFVTRFFNGGCDIGAIEADVVPTAINLVETDTSRKISPYFFILFAMLASMRAFHQRMIRG